MQRNIAPMGPTPPRFAACLLLVAVLMTAVACSKDKPTERTGGSSAPAASEATATPVATIDEVFAVAKQYFPQFIRPADARKPGASTVAFGLSCYGASGVGAFKLAMPGQPCPISRRMQQRLTDLAARIAAEPRYEFTVANILCRCQDLANAQTISTDISSTVILAHVRMFSFVLDLVLVREDGHLVVDDELCSGRQETSIYVDVPYLGGAPCR